MSLGDNALVRMQSNLESLFERYRRRGDLTALTRIFDHTARDLLGLAQHLVRDLHDAEDLVQETFVTAIDRASSWDRGRPLRPWLTGILVRRAANLVRARRRPVDGTSAQAGAVAGLAAGGDDPARGVEALELEASLERALGRVGERYREVLEPFLREGERPEAIARALGRAPGTVRTQIYRGLTRLRRLLPASVGAAALMGKVRGLPAVRVAVMHHGAVCAPAAAVPMVSVTSGLLVGGFIVSKNAFVLGAGALAASLGLWIGVGGSGEPLAPDLPAPLAPPGASGGLARGGTRGGPGGEDGAELASALALAPDELTGTSREEGARSAVRRGRALVRGRLDGVAPEHLEAVALTLRRTPDPQPSAVQWGALDALGRIQGVEERDMREYRIAQVDRSRALNFGYLRQREEWVSRSSSEPTEDVAPDSVRIDTDGTFTIDFTSMLLAHLALRSGGDEPMGDATPRFGLTAAHEVYFEAQQYFTLDAGARARVLAGDDVTLDVQLGLRPAAVLRGRVRRVDEAPPVQTLLVRERPVRATESVIAYRALTLTTEYRMIWSRSQFGSDRMVMLSFPSSGIEVALLRQGAEEPLATTRAGLDGTFEFRLEEDGPFMMVVVVDDRPPLASPVDLALGTVVELEQDVELEPSTRLAGLVEDFGAFPGGGIALEAERLGFAGDQPIEWSRHQLGWSRGEIVRRLRRASTEAGGLFDIEGLSPGRHRLRLLEAGAATLFSAEERDDAAVEVDVPARDVQLVLPLAVLELRAERPPFLEGEGSLRFLVEDGETGALLAQAALDHEDRGEVVARPGQKLRVRVLGEGIEFPAWEGTAPDAGERVVVPVVGREAEENDPQADGDDGY